MPVASSILAEFRRRIKDVRFSARAFGLAITDTLVTSALCEVTSGHLMVSVSGGSAPGMDFDLSNARYDTIGKLYQVISRMPGYRATLDEDANTEHPSVDLEQFGPLAIVGAGPAGTNAPQSTGVDLVHHLFSDSELEEILKNALQRHNPTLTLSTLPPQEWAFVMPLAQSNVCKIQAYDASKRKGLSQTVEDLLAIADTFEKQYDSDTRRLARAIQSPKETNSNIVDEGDVMLGTQVRRSGRTGFMSPLGSVIPPDYAVLLDPDEHDTEDNNVRVVWQRNKNVDFYSYELWMDTRPDVERSREGGLIFVGTPISEAQTPNGQGLYSSAQRLTTSKMVFRSFGANSNSSRSSFATFVEEFGQLIRSFSVGGLEAQTSYYFRLFVIGLNYVATGSNVVRATTKALRCGFIPQYSNPNNPSIPSGSPLSATTGKPGDVVTVTCDSTRGEFTANHTFYFAGLQQSVTILTPYTFTFVVPSFGNPLNYNTPQDVSIVSPNGLVDVLNQYFQVSPPP